MNFGKFINELVAKFFVIIVKNTIFLSYDGRTLLFDYFMNEF